MQRNPYRRPIMTSLAVGVCSFLFVAQSALAAPVQPTWQWLFDEETTSTTALDTGSAAVQVNATINNAAGSSGDIRSTTLAPFNYAGNKSLIAGQMRSATAPLNSSVGIQTTLSVWLRLDTSYPKEAGNSWVLHANGSDSLATALYYQASGAAQGSDPVYWNGAFKGDDGLTHGGAVTGLNDGVWRHMVVVRDGTEVDIWQADLGDTLTKVWTFALPTGDTGATTFNNFFMGGHSSGSPHLFPGQIDEVAIWDSALSDTDVTWLHTNSLSAIPEPAGLALLGLALPALLRRRRGA